MRVRQRRFVLERNRRLSASRLWQLQRNFFEQQGGQAWTTGTVPHYITSNPWIADAYAKVIFAWLGDLCASPETLDLAQPFYVVELGCGSGRFAYHFLLRFFDRLSRSRLAELPVRYVLTDFTEYNLDLLRNHPALQPLVAAGLLDFARYDAGTDVEIALTHSGETLTPGAVANPLAVIANYVFDGIPQDAFTVRAGHLYESLVTLSAAQPEADLDEPALLERIDLGWKHRPVSSGSPGYYGEADLDRILAEYSAELPETTVLLPVAALACLRHLDRLSGGRLLLLSGDKGSSSAASLAGRAEPLLERHGSFSFGVNYHAIGRWFAHRGGELLSASYESANLNVSAGLLGSPPDGWVETRLAFEDAIERRGPDDFFSVKKGIEATYESWSLERLLGWLRLSGWDHNVFLGCFPVLLRQVGGASEPLKAELAVAARRIWESYFPLREPWDLPFHLGVLLVALSQPAEAVELFGHSLRLYGPEPTTAFNLALCHHLLGDRKEALAWIEQALAADPELEGGEALRQEIGGARSGG
ncbi:MAG TPA: hypothetical protein VFE33_23200 [Thermoanaerobaculia bacterium]|nr:hypothetical protein [Thermoanaerobaculia bacterium]